MTERRGSEVYSGDDFIKDLETAWGGGLYFGIDPGYAEGLTNITPQAYQALTDVYNLNAMEERPPGPIETSGNIATNFKNHLVSSMPHKEEAAERIHILACPFCRAVLEDRLDGFLRVCAQVPIESKHFILENRLPFVLSGPGSIVFQDPAVLSDPMGYFEEAKSKASELFAMLDLTDELKGQFEEEYKLAMERFKVYIGLAYLQRDGELHSMIQVLSRMALMQYFLKKRDSQV